MKEFRDYDETMPELVYEVLDYFRVSNKIREIKKKSVLDFCMNTRLNHHLSSGGMVQPDVVHSICEILVEKGLLVCSYRGTSTAGMDSNYLFMLKDEDVFLSRPSSLLFYFNCVVYGFKFIYNAYREFVLPIIVKKDGKESMGTCFRFKKGILTARHCLEVDQVCIPNYKAEKLNQCNVYVSNDKQIDLAYIETGEESPLLSNEANVLDEVLVMGYPKIPMFFDFCTAERATVSSIPTRGTIASIAKQYITRSVGQLMLITARIRGGNSGGPIIGSDGSVVGVAFSEPDSEGDYDEMGYGIAYPIAVFDTLLRDSVKIQVSFVN